MLVSNKLFSSSSFQVQVNSQHLNCFEDYKIYSHFVSYLGFDLSQVDEMNTRTTIHVVHLTQLMHQLCISYLTVAKQVPYTAIFPYNKEPWIGIDYIPIRHFWILLISNRHGSRILCLDFCSEFSTEDIQRHNVPNYGGHPHNPRITQNIFPCLDENCTTKWDKINEQSYILSIAFTHIDNGLVPNRRWAMIRRSYGLVYWGMNPSPVAPFTNMV